MDRVILPTLEARLIVSTGSWPLAVLSPMKSFASHCIVLSGD
jgi:hypothetical protein